MTFDDLVQVDAVRWQYWPNKENKEGNWKGTPILIEGAFSVVDVTNRSSLEILAVLGAMHEAGWNFVVSRPKEQIGARAVFYFRKAG